ncbi:MAG: hypothetical protein RLZZ15_2189 [Verrucomicrobiota bacterium]
MVGSPLVFFEDILPILGVLHGFRWEAGLDSASNAAKSADWDAIDSKHSDTA